MELWVEMLKTLWGKFEDTFPSDEFLVVSHVYCQHPVQQKLNFLQDSIKIQKLKDQKILRSVDIRISEFQNIILWSNSY